MKPYFFLSLGASLCALLSFQAFAEPGGNPVDSSTILSRAFPDTLRNSSHSLAVRFLDSKSIRFHSHIYEESISGGSDVQGVSNYFIHGLEPREIYTGEAPNCLVYSYSNSPDHFELPKTSQAGALNSITFTNHTYFSYLSLIWASSPQSGAGEILCFRSDENAGHWTVGDVIGAFNGLIEIVH